MTETEWLTCTDPTPMVDHLQGKTSDRKLRLFAVACSHDVWQTLAPNPDMAAAVEVAEAFADGLVGEAERSAAQAAITDVAASHASGSVRHANAFAVAWCASGADPFDAARSGARSACSAAADDAFLNFPAPKGVEEWRTAKRHSEQTKRRAREHVTRVLRDIIGNPFRPVTADPSWLTIIAVGLALYIYAERAFDRLPILADALEEAGCDNPDVLSHLRGDGPHVRGCWVVDLLLGKE
jgi:hypothetical protein